MTASPKDFRVGQRVQMHPATDAWMQGDRYGQIETLGRVYLHVKMDRSQRMLPMLPENVLAV